ncbi:MAG: ABC transporter permease subunit, partial [Comamonadaceae bacterium]
MSTAQALLDEQKLTATRQAKFNRRSGVNKIALALSLAAMSFGVFWLVWILWETLRLGISGLTIATLTQMTPPPNEEGGILNAIFGSLVMVGMATCVGTPIGIMAGIYLAEYNPKGWLASVTRFVNDILLSAPSIVIGLFVYAVVVAYFKTFSGLAGAL